jgi:hypothetical protein
MMAFTEEQMTRPLFEEPTAALERAARQDSFGGFLKPDLTPLEAAVAKVEGGYSAFRA